MNVYLIYNCIIAIFITVIGFNKVINAEVEFSTFNNNQIATATLKSESELDNILPDYKINKINQYNNYDIGYKRAHLFDRKPNNNYNIHSSAQTNNYSISNSNMDNQNLEQKQQTVMKYITTKYKNISHQDAYNITKSAFEHARNNNIDPTLLLGLIEKESRFQKHITSRLNAQGLMQVIPKWHKSTIASVVNKNGGDIKSIHNNIEIGTFILKTNLQKYHSITRALQAYNGSHNNTSYPNQVLNFQNNIKRAIEVKTIAL